MGAEQQDQAEVQVSLRVAGASGDEDHSNTALQSLHEDGVTLARRVASLKICNNDMLLQARRADLEAKIAAELDTIAITSVNSKDVEKDCMLTTCKGDREVGLPRDKKGGSSSRVRQLERQLDLERKASATRELAKNQLQEKISVFGHVRKKYILDHDRLKRENEELHTLVIRLREETRVLSRQVATLEAQRTVAGEEEADKIIGERLRVYAEREQEITAELHATKIQLASAHKEVEDLWRKLKDRNDSVEEIRRKSDETMRALKSQMGTLSLAREQDLYKREDLTRQINALKMQLEIAKDH
ncbi:unnamed protein product [Amoebophrya sp. A25]|nr:unnamed protein product [Amoebophrya sp. A25]|eukprot:GSA25T00011164001.1